MLRLVFVACLVVWFDGFERVSSLSIPSLPVDGVDHSEYVNLPESFQIQPAFVAPKPEAAATLPPEPKTITIAIGQGTQLVEYFYMPDDFVLDVLKFVSERTHVSLDSIVGIKKVTFGAVGKTYSDVPLTFSLRLKDVPVVAGDEFEAIFASDIDESNIHVTPSPSSNHKGELPGYFEVKVKVAGLPMFTVPIPRLARGNMVRAIIEDRAAFTAYTVELHRNTRDGLSLQDNDMLTQSDSFFWGTLVDKTQIISIAANAGDSGCRTGHVRALTNFGKSHEFNFDCNTTADMVRLYMENLGLLPRPSETYGYGVIISTKGFFHVPGIDTVPPNEFLVDHGVQNEGIVFLTIACPTSQVYFQYLDQVFPQILNCTTSVDYLSPLFNRLTGQDTTPKFTFINKSLKTVLLVAGIPVLKQITTAKQPIVKIDFPPCQSQLSNIQSITSPSPTPVPVIVPSGGWDSQADRDAPAPPNAIKLGDQQLVQQNRRRQHQQQQQQEHSKFKFK